MSHSIAQWVEYWVLSDSSVRVAWVPKCSSVKWTECWVAQLLGCLSRSSKSSCQVVWEGRGWVSSLGAESPRVWVRAPRAWETRSSVEELRLSVDWQVPKCWGRALGAELPRVKFERWDQEPSNLSAELPKVESECWCQVLWSRADWLRLRVKHPKCWVFEYRVLSVEQQEVERVDCRLWVAWLLIGNVHREYQGLC